MGVSEVRFAQFHLGFAIFSRPVVRDRCSAKLVSSRSDERSVH
jgi:hypothetical protein